MMRVLKFTGWSIFYFALAVALACCAWALIIDAALREDAARIARLDRQMLLVISAQRPLLKDCELHDTHATCLTVTRQGRLNLVRIEAKP